MAGLTDDKAALIQMNHAMQKVTEEMGRLALGAAGAGHTLQKDFTEQLAHLHWVSSAIFDTYPFDGARHHGGGGFAGGRYFGDMESGVLSGRPPSGPSRRSGGGFHGSSLPPSMRVRKYSGMGGPTDLFPHLGAEWATGHLVNPLIKLGQVGWNSIGALHAHMQGSREMLPQEWERLIAQVEAAKRTDSNGEEHPLYSDKYKAQLRQGYKMAKNKHEQAEAHTAGLRMRGKLTDHQAEVAEQQRTKKTLESTKALDDFKTSLTEISHSVLKSGAMYGGIALQSASPDAFATLTGSFKLLAATMGTSLLPASVKVSTGLQRAAKWFESLDSGTKQFYGNLFLIGTGIAGVIALMPRLWQTFQALKALTLGTISAGGKMAGFAGRHPFLAAAGGAALAGASVGLAAGMYGNYRANEFLEHWKQNREDIKSFDLSLTPQALEQTEEYKKGSKIFNARKDLGIVKRMDYLQDFFFKPYRQRQLYLQTEFDKEKEALYNDLGRPEDKKNLFSQTIGNAKTLYNLTFNDSKLTARLDRMKELQKENTLLENVKDYIVNPKDYNDLKAKKNAKYKENQDQAKMGAYGLLLDFQSRTQPAYYGIEDMGKKIQLEALSVSPLQEEIRRIQIQQLDVLLEIAGYSKDQAAELKRSSGLP